MNYSASKLGPTAPPPGPVSSLYMPPPPGGPFTIPTPKPGTPPFQNAPVGGVHYTGPVHPGLGPMAPPPAAPHPPAAPAPTPAPGPGGPPAPTALDSTYYMNVAQNDFRVNNQLAGLQQQQAYGNDDLQRALLQLTHTAALQERQDREQASTRGLLSSTSLAGVLGEHARSAGDQRTSLQTQNSRRNSTILSEIMAAQGGRDLFDQAQQLAAAQRQAAADAANPAIGETLPGTPGAGASSPAPSSAAVNAANQATAASGALHPGGQFYRPRTDAQGHLLPPVPGQTPLVRPGRLPPARLPARAPTRINTNKGPGPVRRAY